MGPEGPKSYMPIPENVGLKAACHSPENGPQRAWLYPGPPKSIPLAGPPRSGSEPEGHATADTNLDTYTERLRVSFFQLGTTRYLF